MEGDELREAVELRNVSWRELQRAVEEYFIMLEDFIATTALPSSFVAELRACKQRLREAWEKELELHRRDMAMIFRRDRV